MMLKTRLHNHLRHWLRERGAWRSGRVKRRGPVTHAIVLDGTMSSLVPGWETNAGITARLLEETGQVCVFYEPGVQWDDWNATYSVLTGKGINRQIRRAYGHLASRYRPGDRIFFFGYSRGAYAVRSLAGMIDRLGLLRAEEANVRNIRQLYRHYQSDPHGEYAKRFVALHCHETVHIEMVGVWETVKALGIRLPFVWQHSERNHAFHSHHIGHTIKHAFHALGLDETRAVFAPVMWESDPAYQGHLEQVWFRGTHGDIGGQLGGYLPARPLANVPLVWMLEKAEACALPLPDGWQKRFPTDAHAPSVGTWQGHAKLFLIRQPRTPLQDPSESLHWSVASDHPTLRPPSGLLDKAADHASKIMQVVVPKT